MVCFLNFHTVHCERQNFCQIITWRSDTVRDIIATISFFITWYIRIFSLSIQDQVTNFGIVRNTNEKLIGFKLRQVVIFVFNKDVNQDDTVILTWIRDGFNVTCGTFANYVWVICGLDLDYIMITFFPEMIRSILRLLLWQLELVTM